MAGHVPADPRGSPGTRLMGVTKSGVWQREERKWRKFSGLAAPIGRLCACRTSGLTERVQADADRAQCRCRGQGPGATGRPSCWPNSATMTGLSAAQRCGERFGNDFRAIRKILDDFNPDFVLVWGDDQYENFQRGHRPAVLPPGLRPRFRSAALAQRQRRQAEPLGRAGRLDAAAERPSRGGEIPRHRPHRTRHRHGLCL